MKSISYDSKVMAKEKVFRYVGQMSLSRPLGQNFWHDQKNLITRNVHEKYESSTSNDLKVMTKVIFFLMLVKSQGKVHQPRCHLKGFH